MLSYFGMELYGHIEGDFALVCETPLLKKVQLDLLGQQVRYELKLPNRVRFACHCFLFFIIIILNLSINCHFSFSFCTCLINLCFLHFFTRGVAGGPDRFVSFYLSNVENCGIYLVSRNIYSYSVIRCLHNRGNDLFRSCNSIRHFLLKVS